MTEARPELTTVGEQSGYVRTGRYDEVLRLGESFAAAFPGRVRVESFGTTAEGRSMVALVASEDGTLTAAEARAKNRPVVFIQAGIHPGEIEGKDAGFLVLRELLEGQIVPGALEQVTLVFVPVYNADGHERFGRWNRPNQNGPEEMGWRTTAQNLNLNRDYMKAEAPETRAMLALLDAWDPALYVDIHATDGAHYQHDIVLLFEPTAMGPPAMQGLGRSLQEPVLVRLKELGHLPVADFYTWFVREDDPASGFTAWVMPPRFSTTYWSVRNRLGLLVETHSWKDYKTRVGVTRSLLIAVLERAKLDAQRWLATERAEDAAAAALAGSEVPLTWKTTGAARTIEFLGCAYTREPSAVSGAIWTRYQPDRPEVWKLPFLDQVTTALVVRAPGAGYVVPVGHAPFVASKLTAHGLRHRVLRSAHPALAVAAWRASRVAWARESFEGRTRLTLEGAWRPETRDVPAGSLFVPISQERAPVLLHLLEPEAPDSLAAWGFFNAVFEQKEDMEAYVAEELARKMMAADPALATAFVKRLDEDAAFAADPRQRLDFFYHRSSSWDERKNLYPIYRVDREP